MKALPAIAAFALCLATAAQAQMTQDQSQDARAALNHQGAVAAEHQNDQNAVNQLNHDDAVMNRAGRIDYNNAVYRARMRRHHHVMHRYHASMRNWRADVAACKAGDHSRCDHTKPMH